MIVSFLKFPSLFQCFHFLYFDIFLLFNICNAIVLTFFLFIDQFIHLFIQPFSLNFQKLSFSTPLYFLHGFIIPFLLSLPSPFFP